MTDSRQQLQMQNLLGRVDTIEKLIPRALSELQALLIQQINILKWEKNVEVLTANKELSDGSDQIQVYDCNGGERTVLLPLEANTNRTMIIVNGSS